MPELRQASNYHSVSFWMWMLPSLHFCVHSSSSSDIDRKLWKVFFAFTCLFPSLSQFGHSHNVIRYDSGCWEDWRQMLCEGWYLGKSMWKLCALLHLFNDIFMEPFWKRTTNNSTVAIPLVCHYFLVFEVAGSLSSVPYLLLIFKFIW